MKQIKNLSDLALAIQHHWDLFEEINGHKYQLNIIILLQKKLLDTMALIKERKLFYSPEF